MKVKINYLVSNSDMIPVGECNVYTDQQMKYTLEEGSEDDFTTQISRENIVYDLDTETNGLFQQNKNKILLVQLYDSVNKVGYVIDNTYLELFINRVNILKKVAFRGHNIKFDTLFLMNEGLNIDNILLLDTSIQFKILNNSDTYKNSKIGLEVLLKDLLNIKLPDFEGGKIFGLIDEEGNNLTGLNEITPVMFHYAVYDILYLHECYNIMDKQLKDNNLYDTFINETKLLKEIIYFTYKGIPSSKECMYEIISAYRDQFKDIITRIPNQGLYLFPKQVISELESIGYELPLTDKGASSLSSKYLKKLDLHVNDSERVVKNYLEIKEVIKILTDMDNRYKTLIVEAEKLNKKQDKWFSDREGGKDLFTAATQRDYTAGLITIDALKIKKNMNFTTPEEFDKFIDKKIMKTGKTKSQYSWLSSKDRIHPDIDQMGTATNRQTMSKPAMHNVPSKIKHFIQAPEKRLLLGFDFKAQEPYILGILSNCKKTLDAYYSGDYHGSNCKILYPLVTGINIDHLSFEEIAKLEFLNTGVKFRTAAKSISLGIMYGMGAATICTNLNIDTTPENIRIVTNMCDKLKTDKINQFYSKIARIAVNTGYIFFGGLFNYRFLDTNITSILNNPNFLLDVGEDGKIFTYCKGKKLNDLRNDNPKLAREQDNFRSKLSETNRRIQNYPIQGGAASSLRYIIPGIMKYIRFRGLDINIAHVVHDEIVFEIPEELSDELIKDIENEIIALNSRYFNTEHNIILESKKSKFQTK